MQISIYVHVVVLVSPDSNTTSVVGVLRLISSFVFCLLVLLACPIFIPFPFPLMLLLFVLLWGSTFLLMIPGGVPLLYR